MRTEGLIKLRARQAIALEPAAGLLRKVGIDAFVQLDDVTHRHDPYISVWAHQLDEEDLKELVELAEELLEDGDQDSGNLNMDKLVVETPKPKPPKDSFKSGDGIIRLWDGHELIEVPLGELKAELRDQPPKDSFKGGDDTVRMWDGHELIEVPVAELEEMTAVAVVDKVKKIKQVKQTPRIRQVRQVRQVKQVKQIKQTRNKADNVARLARAWAMVADALPESYPRPELVLWWQGSVFQGKMCPHHDDECQAVFDGRKIHVPTAAGEGTLCDAVHLMAHEFGHAFMLWKYGEASQRWTDERLANTFAIRWVKKIMGD